MSRRTIITTVLFCASIVAWRMTNTPGARAADDRAALRIRFPDVNVFQSPYTWRNVDGSAIAPTGGSYLKGVVKGTTSIVVNVDTTLNAGAAPDDMPTLKVTVDDEPPAFVQFAPGAARVMLAKTSREIHRFRIEVIGGNQKSGDGWSGAVFQTKIDSLEFDAGATLTPPALRHKRALILGDSNIQAYFGETPAGPYYKYVDYTLAWPGFVAFAFDCEFGQIGVGSTGWIHPGQGGYPAMPDWWNRFDRDHIRDLSPAPDYVWIALGANDHHADPAQLKKVIIEWLTQARHAFPAAQIFLVVPFHGENRAAITAAAGETNVHLIDLGSELESAIPFVAGHPTWLTADGLHLRATYHGLVATAIARQSQAALDQATHPPSPTARP